MPTGHSKGLGLSYTVCEYEQPLFTNKNIAHIDFGEINIKGQGHLKVK